MNVQEQIKKYITNQPEPKRSDMRELHRLTLQVSPECKLYELMAEMLAVNKLMMDYASQLQKLVKGK